MAPMVVLPLTGVRACSGMACQAVSGGMRLGQAGEGREQSCGAGRGTSYRPLAPKVVI